MFRKLLSLIVRPLPRALKRHISEEPECWALDCSVGDYATKLDHSTGGFFVMLYMSHIRPDDVVILNRRGTSAMQLTRIERWMLARVIRTWVKKHEENFLIELGVA